MSWSVRVGRIAGIAVDLHLTFGLLILWLGLSALAASGSLAVAAGEILFAGLVFGIVLLHELGHALTARQLGVHTHSITLLPIGGVARMDGMPSKPQHEMLIALAGPAVNMALATLLLPLAFAVDGGVSGGGFLSRLVWINVGLALFNLLPAFPMDGGRVLRSALALRTGARDATVLAASVGQAIAIAMGVLGLLGSPMLVLIAVFVWLAAEGEKQAALAVPRVRRIVTPDDDPFGRPPVRYVVWRNRWD